ncbi:hypothetical protein BU25DRAFT_387421 [Macroventuria anomochaeta]|uniref:Uncharacterized protein n=1 Tax=Macroventuria anomochaeta TaxID=301207 RepID=A0ACB6S8E9_9PLEO|nr:uncharacterized protein BU25DRAFT_387421 [Macroventuria anomochaeta]KAF2630318.1 hypothetical protein BU25DRAFT_387421 [Macroventuria anomochaeta]
MLFHSMSLHTRCPRRIASTAAHRNVWRQRGVRDYASDTANDPEWFQQVRSELISRKPHYQCEDLDLLHHEQLYTTLGGFVPRLSKLDTDLKPNISLAELLTHFNIRVLSSTLLPDGTDPLHSPGEPWMRRMWAGGAVKLNPDLKLKSGAPFRLLQKVACVERIKDVRLQGTGDEAKVFVTVERRFAFADQLRDVAKSRPEGNVRAQIFQQADTGDDWSDALLKEERNLVFLKAKTAAELIAIYAGQTVVPRYLKSPAEPDFSHVLTPTRSLLFRYSALTFNAHLLHLDPTYARNVEGHRNLLVHGPLTLTLMLQTLNTHLRSSRIGTKLELVDSVEYRNLAPLYCDEEMRVCVKNKKRTETGNLWDVWIEGPTGGMAVKAVVRTVDRGRHASPTERAVEVKTGTDLPDVQTVARQAQDKLHALDQKDSGMEQLSPVSREERRRLWRDEQRQFSRKERKEWAARPLSYLYSASSPLMVRNSSQALQLGQSPALDSKDSSMGQLSQVSREERRKLGREVQTERPPASSPSNTNPQSQRAQKTLPTPSREHVEYSNIWRRRWVGKALPYLYLWQTSALYNRAVVSRQPDSAPAPAPASSAASKPEVLHARAEAKNKIHTVMNPKNGPKIRVTKSDSPETKFLKALQAKSSSTSPSTSGQDPAINAATSPASSPPSSTLSLAQKQRAILLASAPVQVPQSRTVETTAPAATSDWAVSLRERSASDQEGNEGTASEQATESTCTDFTALDSAADIPGSADSETRVRKIESDGPEHVLPLASMHKATGSQDKSPAVRTREAKQKQLNIKKVEQLNVRKIGVGLEDAARRGGKRTGTETPKQIAKALKRDVLAAERSGDGKGGQWR